MKQKLLYLLPLFLLSGCGQATYKNASLPAEERAGLLLKELTLEEKVSLMMDSSKPVERLGIKPYNWWNEALHGVARAGLATVFPQPIGMAASFSPETVYEVFTAVSDEARAKNAYYASQESHERYQGLTMWTPTVNIYRDPRWGRGIERCHARNKQQSWTGIPFSVVASAGHDSLALDMARKSMTLLMNKDNTLPLKRGGLTIAVMGPNANDSVMQWGNYNGMPPHTVTILDGIRKALGSDDRLIYEQGCGWVERAQIQSVFNRCKTADGKPGFTARYWNNVTRDGEPVTTAQVTTPFHFCTSGATVFAPGVNLTDFSATYNSVFTPDQSGEVVFDIYAYGSGRLRINGEEVRGFSNQHGGQKSAYTLQVQAGKTYDVELDFEYFRSDAQLNFDLGFKNEVDVRKSVERVKDADIVVFVGGVSPNLEGEEMGVELPGFRGGDRTDIELPAVQRELIAALHHAGKKVVLVNCSGSPIGLEPETGRCGAILQAWYPGQAGGTAVAEVLFGDYNPAGRLPVTFYRNVSQLPDFEDYNMTGRTYRYMTQEPLFPFGHGLSYTSFSYGAVVLGSDNIKSGEKLRLSVPVTNTGKCDGEEVVQVYLKKNDDVEGPSKALRAFKRVHIPAGKTVDVEFDLGDKELVWWNPQSNAMCVSEGSYELMVGGSSQTADLLRRSFVIQP